MLYVVSKNGGKVYTWHIGESFPLLPLEVTEIQADNDELDKIARIVPANIFLLQKSNHKERVIVWDGKTAQMIAMALNPSAFNVCLVDK